MSATDDAEAIRQLKYRYVRTLDTKHWDEFTDCLHPDITANYAGLAFENRDTLVEFMRSNLPADLYTMHHVHHPEIEVSGDRATGRWYLHDKVISPAMGFMLEGAAIYQDRYRRVDNAWVISHTEYERTFEMSYDLADVPSMKINGPAGS